MNWLQRARREFSRWPGETTANTAEGRPAAALCSEIGSIGSNGSASPWQMVKSDTLREEFEERAAIMEFDGQLTREEAERAAWGIISTRCRLH